MGKKKDGKKPNGKLPKEIGGIKLPKELRKAVDPVLDWVGHPLVSDALAAALVAGATALSNKKKPQQAAKAAGLGAGAGAVKAAKGADRVGLAIAVAAGEIAARIIEAYGAREPDSPKKKAASATRKPAA